LTGKKFSPKTRLPPLPPNKKLSTVTQNFCKRKKTPTLTPYSEIPGPKHRKFVGNKRGRRGIQKKKKFPPQIASLKKQKNVLSVPTQSKGFGKNSEGKNNPGDFPKKKGKKGKKEEMKA